MITDFLHGRCLRALARYRKKKAADVDVMQRDLDRTRLSLEIVTSERDRLLLEKAHVQRHVVDTSHTNEPLKTKVGRTTALGIVIEELRSESEDKTAIQQEHTLLKTAVALHRQTALRLQDEVHVRHQDCVAHSSVLLAALLHHHPKFVFLVRYSIYSRVCILSTHIPSSAVITSDSSSSAFYWHSKQISGPPICPIF